MKKLILISLLIAGCGSTPVQFRPLGLHVDAELAPLVSEFITEARAYGRVSDQVNLNVSFVPEIPSNDPGYITLGQCFMGTGIVQINHTEWEDLSDNEKEELIFHELGHCLLNRQHNDGLFATGMPVSMMYWLLVDERWYVQYKAYYWNEMFTNY